MRFYLHAHRDALILFKVALGNDELDKALADMHTVRDAVTAHTELWRSLAHPAFPAAEKSEFFKKKFCGSVAAFLNMIVEKRETRLLPAIAGEFSKLVKKYRKVEELLVETPMPLGEKQLLGIGEKVSKAFGRRVTIVERVHPEIIGGLVIRFKDTVADFSYRSRLKELRGLMSG